MTCQAIKKNGLPCTYPVKTVNDDGTFVCLVHKTWVSPTQNLVNTPNMALTVEPPINVQKGTTMPLSDVTQFLQCPVGKPQDHAPRMITNMMTPGATKAVLESKALNGRPVVLKGKEGNYDVMHLDGGIYHFPLLERASARGVKFKIACFTQEYLKGLEDGKVLQMLLKANFAWGTAKQSFFVEFPDMTPGYWGLDPFGINVHNKKKLQKRLAEITRFTAHSYLGPISMEEFPTPKGDMDIFYDGINAISSSFAKKLGFDGNRGNIRVLTPQGLIKGDAVVVHGLHVDILYHTLNLKDDITTDGFTMATIDNRDAIHELRHDDQSTGNLAFFFTEDVMTSDLEAMAHDYKESIAEGGDLHNYLSDASKAFDNPLDIDLGLIQMSETMEEQTQMLKSFGIAPAMFSNITYTRIGALVRKMKASEMEAPNKGVYKGMFIPTRNAVSCPVATWEFYTKMCKISFPDQDGTRTFFDKRFGLVIPGMRFHNTAPLHGGPDSDDHYGEVEIKVFCSDPARLRNLRKYHVLDPVLNIGATAEEAVTAALTIRNPNGPGEYSIDAIDPNIPWKLRDETAVVTYDLALAPLCQAEIFPKDFKFGVIPTSVTFDRDEFGRPEGMDMVFAQMENPQFGSFANVLMAWMQTFGDGHTPSIMIDRLEAVVDCVQQTADAVSFRAIATSIEQMWIEYRDTVIDTQTMVDEILLKTRVRKFVGSGDDRTPIAQAIRDAGCVAPGYHTRMQKRYIDVMNELTDMSKALACITRNNLPMAVAIRELKFGVDMKNYVDEVLSKAMGGLREIGDQYNDENLPKANAILRRRMQVEKKEAIEKFMDSVVDKMLADPSVNEQEAVLAMYKLITTPRVRVLRSGRRWPLPHGDVDRVLIQSGSKGHTSMLELFITAVAAKGLIDS